MGPLQEFALSRLRLGLPEFAQLSDYTRGPVARERGLARSQTARSLAGAGINPNDPVAQQIFGDLEASSARSFDQRMLDLILAQEQARQRGGQFLAGIGAARSPYPALSLWRDLEAG